MYMYVNVTDNYFSNFKSPELKIVIFLSLPDFHQGQCTQHPKKGNNKVKLNRTTNYTLNLKSKHFFSLIFSSFPFI